MEAISNAFCYYFICVCLAGGHAYTIIAEHIRKDEKNGDLKMFLIALGAFALAVIVSYIYYNATNEKRALLNMPLAFLWGGTATVVVNTYIGAGNFDDQKAYSAFLSIIASVILFMLFDVLHASKKLPGFVFLGTHCGVSMVLLSTAMSKKGVSFFPDLDFLGDTRKFVIFLVLGIVTTIICGEILKIKFPGFTLGEDMQAWGIFLGMAILISVIFTTAVPTSSQMIICPGTLFATSVWALSAYKIYKTN